MRNEVTYFNKKSKAYRAEYERETAEGYQFRVRREKVLALVGDGKNVVDIASGPGVMVQALQDMGCTVTCVDAAPEMIARAKEEFPDVEAVVGDAYELPFEDKRFDIATAMGLIEYLDDERRFLKEASRILKPEGTLIITFPNYASPYRAFNRLLLSVVRIFKGPKPDSVTHREYTRSGAAALLSENGFATDHFIYYNFKLIPYPLDRIFHRTTVLQSKIFEKLDRSILSFVGTGFIIKAHKVN
jgi:ubiquinone/menaquinone biosynthesis C-methylase UbiE